MSADVVVDLSYGDSGKGRVCDYLSKDYDIGVRFNGSCNSGHTIYVNGKKYVTHLVPAMALRCNKVSVICPGVSIDLDVLREDCENLGVGTIGNSLLIDGKCPIITEVHKVKDSGNHSEKIGTTKRGVGPCISDQVNRSGIRYKDCKGSECTDTREYLYNSIIRGKKVLFEGAQGTFLDLWHGTYPYVTSGSTLAGAVCTNAGIPPKMITKVYGVFKAYTTRVGNGPFLTEDFSEFSDYIRKVGKEYGATTGRPRRVGWLDLVDTRLACDINGVDWLVMTKADVLDGLSHFKICVDRTSGGEPIYKEFPLWDSPISGLTRSEQLPDQFRRFIGFIEDHVYRPITLVSTGRERKDMVVYG